MQKKIVLLCLIGCIQFSCNPQNNSPSGNSGGSSGSSADWLIPQGQVFDGGPGKDGIPALSNPIFVSLDQISYLSDEDLVIGFSHDGEYRAYPHNILDWHEIINDDLKGAKIAITYCPLTGTGIAWDRVIQGTETTFGVSGLLYNSNLIPYDRHTDSNWSQINLNCVNGVLKGERARTHQVLETTWKTWKEMYPNSMVMTTNTGFSRNYANYPYGDYRTNNEKFLFPVSPSDERIPSKERVLALIDDNKAKVYRFSNFEGGTKILIDNFNENGIVVIGDKEKNFMVAYKTRLDGSANLAFELAVEANKPIIFRDNKGNKYNLLGNVIEGPDKGLSLYSTTSFMAYWFSIAAFYQAPIIYSGGN